MTPAELAKKWREAAETLQLYGQPETAQVLRGCANSLDAAMRSLDDDKLSLAEAAQESGLSADRLRHMVAEGKLPQAGKKGSPRIRRGDLPLKRRVKGNGFDAVSAARSILRRADHA